MPDHTPKLIPAAFGALSASMSSLTAVRQLVMRLKVVDGCLRGAVSGRGAEQKAEETADPVRPAQPSTGAEHRARSTEHNTDDASTHHEAVDQHDKHCQSLQHAAGRPHSWRAMVALGPRGRRKERRQADGEGGTCSGVVRLAESQSVRRGVLAHVEQFAPNKSVGWYRRLELVACHAIVLCGEARRNVAMKQRGKEG